MGKNTKIEFEICKGKKKKTNKKSEPSVQCTRLCICVCQCVRNGRNWIENQFLVFFFNFCCDKIHTTTRNLILNRTRKTFWFLFLLTGSSFCLRCVRECGPTNNEIKKKTNFWCVRFVCAVFSTWPSLKKKKKLKLKFFYSAAPPKISIWRDNLKKKKKKKWFWLKTTTVSVVLCCCCCSYCVRSCWVRESGLPTPPPPHPFFFLLFLFLAF